MPPTPPYKSGTDIDPVSMKSITARYGGRHVGVPQGSVLGPLLLFLLCTSELFSIQENKLIGYADDSTLIAVVPSPGVRVTVAESPSSDLVKVSERCELWGMKLNAAKTMIFCIPYHPH